MEKNSSKQVGSFSSSGSSSIAELFGPKTPSSSSTLPSSSSASSTSIFGSVFGPPSMGRGRDSTSQAENVKHGAPDNKAQSKGESSRSSYYRQETIDQPCNFSSSIYYGGQEVYSPTTRTTDSQHTFKKDEKDNDDPDSASRGNWWQGSLYY